VAVNNDYGSASLVQDETGWIIVDSKHPVTGHAAASPDAATFHALKAGSFFFNADESTSARTLGWAVERSGSSAGAPQPGITATAVRQSASITPGTNEHVLAAGDHVQLGTVTFDRRASGGTERDAYARVVEVRVGSILLDGAANESASEVPVRYRDSVVSQVPRMARSLDAVAVPNTGAVTFDLAGSFVLLTIAEVGATGSSAMVMASNGRLFIAWQDAARYAIGSNVAGRINLSLAGRNPLEAVRETSAREGWWSGGGRGADTGREPARHPGPRAQLVRERRHGDGRRAQLRRAALPSRAAPPGERAEGAASHP
jgi:hypothetical protein